MQIHWFPGHMAKAKREITELLKLVDLVLEVRDARIPISSRNPDINRLTAGKERIILLNKSDLADNNANAVWIKHLTKDQEQTSVLAVNAKSGEGFQVLLKMLKKSGENLAARLKERGRLPRPLRILVVGIPNVGKSTVLNRMAGRKAAKTGDLPGVTRGKQWITLAGGIEMLDSPGLLPPKIEDPDVGVRLAMIGTIPEELVDQEELACRLLSFLTRNYANTLSERYGVVVTSEQSLEEAHDLLAVLAKKRGCLQTGGSLDLLRMARILFDDFRSGKLGRITLELPLDEIH
ncbi:MAG: ribosome biogenesis GTPase YlqF [Bacillota bacterium]